jgi:hypothetical protein
LVGVGRELIGSWSELVGVSHNGDRISSTTTCLSLGGVFRVSFRMSLEGLGAPLRGIKGQSRKSRKNNLCVHPFGDLLVLCVVLTTVVALFASFWRFGGHFGGLSPHVDGSGNTFGVIWAPRLPLLAPFGSSWCLFGVIWDLLGPLWAPLGRPGAARGAKVENQAGGSEKWTLFGSHFGRVLGSQNHPKK